MAILTLSIIFSVKKYPYHFFFMYGNQHKNTLCYLYLKIKLSVLTYTNQSNDIIQNYDEKRVFYKNMCIE